MGIPAEEETMAVRTTGWPRVVVVVLADSIVAVPAGVMFSKDGEDVEPAFAASPL